MSESESFRFLFFSEMHGKPVIRADGSTLGRLLDLVVVTGEPYPPVESLLVRSGRKTWSLPWTSVSSTRGALQLRPGTEPVPLPTSPEADRVRLGQEVLDRQIVDIEGAKLVRVNDLHFLESRGQLRVVHVDISLRGLVRRMGWQPAVDRTVGLVKPEAKYLKDDALLSWKLVQPIESAPGRVRVEATKKALASLHPADLASIIEELDRDTREVLFHRLDVETAADALEEASPELVTSLLEAVAPETAADILEEMAPDKAADALSELPGQTRAELLSAMERPEAAEVAQLLKYHPQSAGGLMTPDLVALPLTATVADALAEVRLRADELPVVYEVFVIEDGALRGLVNLKELIAAEPTAALSAVLRKPPGTATAGDNLRHVARLAAKYNLLSVPVVDDDGVLVGMVTVDDILAEVLDD